MTKSVFVTLAGHTNAGKSSLLNAIIGEKIASVSPKPQTTRTRITGIKTVGETQMVFMDTPGLHKPTTKLSGHMLKAVKDAVADIDAVLFVQDCTKPLSEQEEELLHSLEKAKTPTILVLNKIDLCSDKTRLMGTIARLNAVHSFAATIPVSVTESDGIDLVEQEGIADADVVICLTDDDRLNLMLALIAKHLGAKKTIVRVSRIEYSDLMEKVGVDIVLSTRLLSASEVLAFARRGGVVSVSLLEGAKAEAVEVIVQDGAPVAGKRLMDVRLPKECLVCAYVRDGEAYIPNGQSVLMAGDRIILFIQTEYSKKVMKYFKGRE